MKKYGWGIIFLFVLSIITSPVFAKDKTKQLNNALTRSVSAFERKIERALKSLDKKQVNILKNANKASISICRYSKADFDRNGKVDDIDKIYFDFCFQTNGRGVACRATANLDKDKQGNVDQSDLSIFAEEYQKSESGDTASLCAGTPAAGLSN